MLVLDLVLGSLDKNSTHSLLFIQFSTYLKDSLDLLIKESRPPIALAQFNASKASSTHNIDGVLIVLPSKIPDINFFFDAILKIFGIGQEG